VVARRRRESRTGDSDGVLRAVQGDVRPVVAIFEDLSEDPDRRAELDRELREFAEDANRGAAGAPAEYPYEYLLVVARTSGP